MSEQLYITKDKKNLCFLYLKKVKLHFVWRGSKRSKMAVTEIDHVTRNAYRFQNGSVSFLRAVIFRELPVFCCRELLHTGKYIQRFISEKAVWLFLFHSNEIFSSNTCANMYPHYVLLNHVHEVSFKSLYILYEKTIEKVSFHFLSTTFQKHDL